MTPERWSRIKDVFQATLEIEPQRRGAYLSEACAGNPTLLREVENLLRSSDQANDFMETPALDTSLVALVEEQPESQIGRRIGPYELTALVGEGGMGSVYRAVRQDDFKKQVAIKLVKRGMDTEFILRRFRTERRILAGLTHPNIAQLIDGGITGDGLPYFVMEYIEGTPIHEYCDAGNLPTRERLQLFSPVCAALQYAHQNLVIHRDIKPTNILVTTGGVPKLLDFGIAKLVSRDPDGVSNEPTAPPTVPMMRMMTPDYASPEQIRGEPITTASDVYSLGVLLYELLASSRPYRFAGRPTEEIARVLAETDPRPPSAASDRRLDRDLDTIVLKAMHKEAQRRYASAQQLADDIARYLEGKPVWARKDTFGYRATKFVRRHKAGVTAVALICLTLIGGMAATFWQAGVAAAQRDSARQRYFDVRDLANSFLFEIDDALVNLSGSTRARELVVKRGLQYLDLLNQQPGADVSLHRELATAYEKMGDVQGGPKSSNLGDSAGALVSYRKTLGILEQLSAADPANAELKRDLARAYVKIGDVFSLTGDYKTGLDYDRRALGIREALLAADPGNYALRQDVGYSFHEIASNLSNLGDWAGVLEYRRRALSVFQQLAVDNPSDARTQRGLALALKRMGRALVRQENYTGALRHYDQALAIEKALAAQNPADAPVRIDLSFTYLDIGYALAKMGNHTAALPNCRKALEIREALSIADPKDVRISSTMATACMRVAQSLLETGDTAGSIEYHRKALSIREGLATIDPLNAGARGEVAESYTQLGDAYKRSGRCAQAVSWYRRGLTLFSDLRDRGKLIAELTTEPDRIAREIAVCEAGR